LFVAESIFDPVHCARIHFSCFLIVMTEVDFTALERALKVWSARQERKRLDSLLGCESWRSDIHNTTRALLNRLVNWTPARPGETPDEAQDRDVQNHFRLDTVREVMLSALKYD
jgi:hypothetical protein